MYWQKILFMVFLYNRKDFKNLENAKKFKFQNKFNSIILILKKQSKKTIKNNN